MFHRVKSETSTETSAASTQASVEKTKSATAERVSGETQSAPTSTQKDQQPMTQTTADAPTAQADTNSAYVAPTGYRANVASPQSAGYTSKSYPSHTAAEAAKQKAEETADVVETVEAPVETSTPVEGSQLVIGRGITMSGEIEHCDTLVVEGTVEAALKGANILEIAESGVFYGAVNIQDATISGRFEGDIVVNGRLSITSTGVVTGSISYGELEIEGGAVIEGKISPVKTQVSAQKQEKTQAAREAAALARARELSQETAGQLAAANSDEGELFSSRS